MKNTFGSFLVAVCLWSGPAWAVPQIQHWTTANGARVYFVPARELPIVDIQVVWDAGSARDGRQSGLALLTNDLLNEGAGPLNADQIAERFEAVGAQFNAHAERDTAVVALRSLTDPALLNPAVDTLALILSHPTFPEASFERERNRTRVALREQQQDPGAIASQAFFAAVYPGHPYGSLPLGREATLKALQVGDLRAFYRRYYVGRNAVVAIVGDVDRPQAERLAEQVVGPLPPGEPPAAVPPVQPLTASIEKHLPYPSVQTHVLIGQPGMRRDDADYFPLYVGNHILGGGGLVSRINDEIREKRGLSYNAYSYFTPLRAEGPFTAGLETRTDQAPDAIRVLRQVIRDFVANGPTEEELKAAQKNITGGFALRLDSNAKIIQSLAAIGFYGLPLDYLDTFNRKVEAVTVAQIRDAFQRRLHPERMVTVVVGAQTTAP